MVDKRFQRCQKCVRIQNKKFVDKVVYKNLAGLNCKVREKGPNVMVPCGFQIGSLMLNRQFALMALRCKPRASLKVPKLCLEGNNQGNNEQ